MDPVLETNAHLSVRIDKVKIKIKIKRNCYKSLQICRVDLLLLLKKILNKTLSRVRNYEFLKLSLHWIERPICPSALTKWKRKSQLSAIATKISKYAELIFFYGWIKYEMKICADLETMNFWSEACTGNKLPFVHPHWQSESKIKITREWSKNLKIGSLEFLLGM